MARGIEQGIHSLPLQDLNEVSAWARHISSHQSTPAGISCNPQDATFAPVPAPPALDVFLAHAKEVIAAPTRTGSQPLLLQTLFSILHAIIPALLLLLMTVLMLGSGITGMTTFTGPASYEVVAHLNIQATVSSSRNMTLQLPDMPTTVRISGAILGNGTVILQPHQRVVFSTTRDSPPHYPFTSSCRNTCTPSTYGIPVEGPAFNVTLEILLDAGSELNISTISYTYEPANHAPGFNPRLANLSARTETNLTIDLAGYVTDADNDSLTFIAAESPIARISIDGTRMTIAPAPQATGLAHAVLYASDLSTISSLNMTITIQPDIPDEELTAANAPFFLSEAVVESVTLLDGTPVLIKLAQPPNPMGDTLLDSSIKEQQEGFTASVSPADVRISKTYTHIPVIAATITKEGLSRILSNPDIEAVYPDEAFVLSETDPLALVQATTHDRTITIPTPGQYPDPDHDPAVATRVLQGEGQTACLIDTGVFSEHPLLNGKILDGYNSMHGTPHAEDDNGHGTAVAGILASELGIAPASRILAVKACDFTGSCKASAILAALDHCLASAARFNITTIIGSFGDGKPHTVQTCPTTFDAAITRAHQQGITLAFAAGNNGYFDGINYPACDRRVISVGSSSRDGSPAPFTNQGERLDLAAPGTEIMTTMIGGTQAPVSGTSISTAFAAGAGMILREAAFLNGSTITPDQVKEILVNHSNRNQRLPLLDLKNALSIFLQKPPSALELLDRNATTATAQTATTHQAAEMLKDTTRQPHQFHARTQGTKTSALVDQTIAETGAARVIIELAVPQFSDSPDPSFGILSQPTGVHNVNEQTPTGIPNTPLRDDTRAMIKHAQQQALSMLTWRTQEGSTYTTSTSTRTSGMPGASPKGLEGHDFLLRQEPDHLPYLIGTISKQGLARLESNPSVTAIYPDTVRELLPTILANEEKPSFDVSIPSIEATKAREAFNVTGKGVIVAVIDSGIDYTHPDLGNCTTSQFLEGTCPKYAGGFNFCQEPACTFTPDPMDTFGHGSHVAGIIGATGATSMKGIAPDAQFLAIKTCNATGSCPDSSVIAGIDYAIAHNADLISLSLGSNLLPNDGRDAVSIAASHAAALYGITVIAAAGNSGPGTGSIASPAAAPHVISVGASNDRGTIDVQDDLIASFSNRGPSAFGRAGPHLAAPGVSINSTVPNPTHCSHSSGMCSASMYKVSSGTSFSAPHATGVAALLLEQHPFLTPREVAASLLSSAAPLTAHPFDAGPGLLNASGALSSPILIMLNHQPTGTLEAFAGSMTDFNISVTNNLPEEQTITISIDSISEPNANHSIASSAFAGPRPFTLAGNSTATVQARITVPASTLPHVYGSRITAQTDRGARATAPLALTVPFFSDGSTTGKTANAVSATKTGDIHYYKIQTPNASRFTTTLTWPNPAHDLDLYLFSEHGLLLSMSAGLDDPERITAANLQDKASWLAVHGYTVPSAGTAYTLSIAYTANLSLTPSRLSATIPLNHSRSFSFTVTNDHVPKTITASLQRLQQGSQREVVILTPGGSPASPSMTTYSLAGNGINVSGIKRCNATLTWDDPSINLDLGWFTSTASASSTANASGTATGNVSRGPYSMHDNSILTKAEEHLTDQDIAFLASYFTDAGLAVFNTNATATTANLSVTCLNMIPAPEARTTPEVLSLDPGEQQSVTITVNASTMPAGLPQTYALSISTDPTHEIGHAPVTILGVDLPEQNLSSHFNGRTTNLDTVQDLTAIDGMTLEAAGKGLIQWAAPIDARASSFHTAVQIDSGLISLNASALHPSLNSSIHVSMTGADCSGYALFGHAQHHTTTDEVIAAGSLCNEGTNPACTAVLCNPGPTPSASTLSFDASHPGSFSLISGLSNTSINASLVRNSVAANTTISRSRVNDSTLLFSSINNASMTESLSHNSTIDNATIWRAQIRNTIINASILTSSSATNSTILEVIATQTVMTNSYVDPSNITNSTITNSFVEDSRIDNSTIILSNVTNATVNASLLNLANVSNATIRRATIHNTTFFDTTIENVTISNGNNLSCGQTLTASINLSFDVQGTTPCYSVGADGITINCNGYRITGIDNGAVINITGRNGIRVINCNIFAPGTAVLIAGSNHTNLINVSAGHAIINQTGFAVNATFNRVLNASTVFMDTTAGHSSLFNMSTNTLTLAGTGINISNSTINSSATITGENATITRTAFLGTQNAITLSGTGHVIANNSLNGSIALGSLSSSRIADNNLTRACIGTTITTIRRDLVLSGNRIISCTGTSAAIRFEPALSSNITITSNQILSSSIGLRVTGGTDWTILGNTFNASGTVAITSINNTLFANNTIAAPADEAAMDITNLSHADIRESVLANGSGSSSIGIRLLSPIENGTFIGLSLSNNTLWSFSQCVSSRSGITYPVRFNGTRIFGNTLTNCTIALALEANASPTDSARINISHTQIFSASTGILLHSTPHTRIEDTTINATSSISVHAINTVNLTMLNATLTGSARGLVATNSSGFFVKDTLIANATTQAVLLNASRAGILVNLTLNSSSASIAIQGGLNHTINQTNAHPPVILENTSVSKINFTIQVNFSSNASLESFVNLSNNSISINSSITSQFNITALLTFTVSINEPTPGYDPEQDGSFSLCPTTRCFPFGNESGQFVFNVTGFSSYNVLTPFPGTTIANSTVTGTIAQNSTITNSTVSNATLNRTIIINSTIDNSTIVNASVTNSPIDNSTLSNTTSQGSPVNASLIEGSSLINSTVSNAIVNLSILGNTSIYFSNASQSITNTSRIENASLSSTNATRSTINDTTTDASMLVNATVTASTINQTRMDNTTVIESNLTASIVNSSHIDRSNIENSTVRSSRINLTHSDNSTVWRSNLSASIANSSEVTNSSFSNSNVTGATISRSTLTNSTVLNSSLTQAIAVTAAIDNATIHFSNLTMVRFNHSQAFGSTLTNSTAVSSFSNQSQIHNSTVLFSNLTLFSANASMLENASLTNGTAWGSVINNSMVSNGTVSNATLGQAITNLTLIDNATIHYSNATQSTINRSRIETTDITESTVLDSTANLSVIHQSSTVRNTTLENATTNLSSVHNATIQNASILSSTVNATVMLNSTLLNTSTLLSIVNTSTLENATLRNTNTSYSTLHNVPAENSTLHNANLSLVNVSGSWIENVTAFNSSITTSNLTNVTIINSTIAGETLANDVILNGFSVAACGKILSRKTALSEDLTCAFNGLVANTTNTTINCAGFTITGNATATGITISLRSNVTIQSCRVANFSTAVLINRTNLSTLSNLFVRDSAIGILLINTTNITITNVSTVANRAAGMLIDPVDNITIENSTFEGGADALLLIQVNASRIAFNTIENASTGLNLTVSYTNQIRNNTFKNNNVSLLITSGRDNLAFFNNFSQAGILHVSSSGGNAFNTTAGGQPAGNEYDNTRILRIYDQNSDGYGEQGPDYPYNSSNNGTVSINVSDYGPRTNRTDLAPVQSGTLNNLTLTQGTNHTTINLSAVFTDPDNDPLNFSSTGNESIGVVINTTSSMVRILAPANFTGSETITFIANDSILRTTAVITITVEAAPPLVTPSIGGPSVAAGGGAEAGPSGPSAPAVTAPPIIAPPAAPVAAPKPTGPPPQVQPTVHVESPDVFRGEILTKIKDTPIACGYRTKKAVEQEIVTTMTALTDVPLPKGFVLGTSPFSLSCSGDSLDLTLNLPSPLSDIRALRCKKQGCDTIVEKEVTTQELVCAGKTISQIRKEEITARKETLSPQEIGIITQEGSIITPEKRTVVSGKNRVEFTKDISKPFRIDISSPKTEVPIPKNPSASIIGTPLEIVISGPQGPLAASVTLPYLLPEQFDPATFALFARSDKDWVYIPNSRRDPASQTITADIPDILKYTLNGVAQFAVIGVGCAACERAKLDRVHAPEGVRTAVILLHGFASSPKTWQFLIDDFTLSQQPYQIYTFEYSSSQPLAKTAREFEELMEAHHGNFDAAYLVAHSLGGFVIQQALADAKQHGLLWPTKIKKAILIGTPNDGTPGTALYERLYSSLVNEQNFLSLYNPNSSVLQDLSRGINLPQIPSIAYYAMAGTKSYDFAMNAFRVATKTGNIILPNDGITTTTSAQHIGGIYLNNSCSNYFELNATHTELLDNPVARRVIERIISEDQFKQTGKGLGYNQFLRLQIDNCSPDEQFVIIGKPVKPEEAPAPLNCNCGNNVCGIDESPETCPKDCALKLERPAAEIAQQIAAYLIIIAVLGSILWGIWRRLKKSDARRALLEGRKTKTDESDRQGLRATTQWARKEPGKKEGRARGSKPLQTFELLKQELSELTTDIQNVFTKPETRTFYPPVLTEKKARQEPRQTTQKTPTTTIHRLLEEISNRYPLARKRTEEKHAPRQEKKGTNKKATAQERASTAAAAIGQTAKRQLQIAAAELSRILTGQPSEKRDHSQRQAPALPAPPPLLTTPTEPKQPLPKPFDKQHILNLIQKIHRPFTPSKESKEQTQPEPPKLSAVLKQEVDRFIEDSRRIMNRVTTEQQLPSASPLQPSPKEFTASPLPSPSRKLIPAPTHSGVALPHTKTPSMDASPPRAPRRRTHEFQKELASVITTLSRITSPSSRTKKAKRP